MNRSRTTKDHPYNLDGLGNKLINWCVESWSGDSVPYKDSVGRLFLDEKSGRLAVTTKSGVIYCGRYDTSPYNILGTLDCRETDHIELINRASLIKHKLFSKTKVNKKVRDGHAVVVSGSVTASIDNHKYELNPGDLIIIVGSRLIVSNLISDDSLKYISDNDNSYGYVSAKSKDCLIWKQKTASDMWKIDVSVFPKGTSFSIFNISTPGGQLLPISPMVKESGFIIIDVFYKITGTVILKTINYEG